MNPSSPIPIMRQDAFPYLYFLFLFSVSGEATWGPASVGGGA